MAALGAQSFANTDFPGPLGDGNQHDIHDANAAHHQRNGGDSRQNSHHHVRHGVHLVHHLCSALHIEIAVVPINFQ